MYIGSIRFFKHLILTVIALMIIIPTAGCVFLAHQYNNLKIQSAAKIDALASTVPTALSEESVSAQPGDEDKKAGSSFVVYAADKPPETQETPTPSFPYQSAYPELYVDNDFKYVAETEKTAYLTFDDGPTKLTPKILDILKSKGVKATFFVKYQGSDEAKALYRRIVDEGHTLALHTASHDYKKIYQSVDSFLADYAILSDMLEDVTGVKPDIFRFPGGSINSYNKEIYQELIAEMLRRGYTYYDWDVSAGSSTSTATAAAIYSNVINGISGRQRAIILMHDAGTSATVTALPDIIDTLKASGYKLEVLNRTIKPSCFGYSN